MRAARRAALADGTGEGLRVLVTGATVAGVLALRRLAPTPSAHSTAC
jgi:hypothetical protein